MSEDLNGVKVGVKRVELCKWENDADGKPMKHKPPLQILVQEGEDQPFVETFCRPDFDPETGLISKET